MAKLSQQEKEQHTPLDEVLRVVQDLLVTMAKHQTEKNGSATSKETIKRLKAMRVSLHKNKGFAEDELAILAEDFFNFTTQVKKRTFKSINDLDLNRRVAALMRTLHASESTLFFSKDSGINSLCHQLFQFGQALGMKVHCDFTFPSPHEGGKPFTPTIQSIQSAKKAPARKKITVRAKGKQIASLRNNAKTESSPKKLTKRKTTPK